MTPPHPGAFGPRQIRSHFSASPQREYRPMTFTTHQTTNPGKRYEPRVPDPIATATTHDTVNPGERFPEPARTVVVAAAVRRYQAALGALALVIATTMPMVGLPLFAAPIGALAGFLIARAK